MATRDASDGQIQFDKMGGLNERPAPNALPAPDLAVCHALYQRNAGALQRLEGTKTLAALPNGVGVFGGAQLDDGTGNIVVQGDNGTEYLFTLDELFGRTVASNLTFLPLPDDENMPTAQLLQDAANNTDLATIGGASANVWYQRPLTSLALNESTIILAFAANQFTVAAGTYRVRGYVTCAVSLAVSGGSAAATAQIGFQFAINDTTNSATKCVSNPAKIEFDRGAAAGVYTLGPLNMIAYIDDTFVIAPGPNAVLEIQNAFSSAATGVSVNSVTGGTAADVSTVLNGAAVRQPYVKLNIAKVA